MTTNASLTKAAISSNNSFADKVVLITGGTAGIGRATAVAFARHGAHVVVSGRRETEGEESVALVEKVGGDGLFVRADVTSGIRVNAVCPAIVETDMTAIARDDDQTRNGLLLLHPVRRFGSPEEIADAVLWLSSPGAAFVTGIALPVDGGFIG
jgi:NAD(P)-dependent dehydrogenase (short-subunit alcohol dehydrogenase family)